MSAIPMARRPLCRDCARHHLSSGCCLLRFWSPRGDTDEARGAAWLAYQPQDAIDATHALAVAAWGYQEGDAAACQAHRVAEVER